MTRRRFFVWAGGLAAGLAVSRRWAGVADGAAPATFAVVKSEAEWRAALTPEGCPK